MEEGSAHRAPPLEVAALLRKGSSLSTTATSGCLRAPRGEGFPRRRDRLLQGGQTNMAWVAKERASRNASPKGSWLSDCELQPSLSAEVEQVFLVRQPGSFMRPTCAISATDDGDKGRRIENLPYNSYLPKVEDMWVSLLLHTPLPWLPTTCYS